MFSTDAGSHADDAMADRGFAGDEGAGGGVPGEADSPAGAAASGAAALIGQRIAADSAGDAAAGGWRGEADSLAGAGVGGWQSEADPAADISEESFFGMQSEASTLTGVALGPGLRRAALVCVGALVGLGVLFWGALALYFAYRVFFDSPHVNPDMPHLPDARPWTAFYLVGAVWGVGVGLVGLVSRWRPRLLLWCFACLLTAFFWPVGMALSAAAVVWRARNMAAARRIALAALAVLVAVGGPVWRFAAPSSSAEPVAVGSDGTLSGTWRSSSGMSVVLRADGTYTAGALSGGGLGAGDGVPASAGMWDTESPGGHSGVRLQIEGDLSHSVWFDVYKAGPDLVLCASADPAEPCQVVLRRS